MKKLVVSDETVLPVLLCPECGFEYNHINSFFAEPLNGTMLLMVDAFGIKVTGSDAAERQRGVKIVLNFRGECGHDWWASFLFRKGVVLVETGVYTVYDEEDHFTPGENLWRD